MSNLSFTIRKGDIVIHQLSKLYFRCENTKMERWMNENKYYQKAELPRGYIL